MHDLIPPTIKSTTIYPLRNGRDLIVPFCRLSSTNSSFVPSAVREWNELENSVRNLDTPSKFKRALLINVNEINIVPNHFLYGPRKLNVILTQLRCSVSFLKSVNITFLTIITRIPSRTNAASTPLNVPARTGLMDTYIYSSIALKEKI
jgi:hypothetical protein